MMGVQEHLSYTKTQFPCCSLSQGKLCFEPLCTTEADTVKLTSCGRALSGTHARHHDPVSRVQAGLCPNVQHPEVLTPPRRSLDPNLPGHVRCKDPLYSLAYWRHTLRLAAFRPRGDLQISTRTSTVSAQPRCLGRVSGLRTLLKPLLTMRALVKLTTDRL